MMLIKKRSFLLLLLTAFITSCSTYYQKALLFQRSLQNDDPGQALTSIENIKTLKKKRNALLYLLEKGKLQHLNKNHAESNRLFNQADTAIEDLRINYGAKTLSYLTNPEVEPYRPEDFEKVSIHYYKALNYFALKQYDDALVEAKRINLQLQKINDRYPEGKKNRYTSDAFSLILQGLIYEATGNINDAFISYRNATELYLKNDGIYYGVNTPDQLKKDLIRTASLIGFTDEQKPYEKLFKISAKDIPANSRELLLFWENGLGPVKNQTYYTFTLLPGKEMGIATVFNKELNLAIPLPLGHKRDKSRLSDIEMFNVAFPKYETRAPFYTQAKYRPQAPNTPSKKHKISTHWPEKISKIAAYENSVTPPSDWPSKKPPNTRSETKTMSWAQYSA